jgi:thymidylate synthase ThyX
MQSRYGMVARLVWDGGDEVHIPGEMGTPALNQMQGTAGERLTELSGRACYDSLGRGRSSPDYHTHILGVGHFSVCEHFHATIHTGQKIDAWALVNRPGIWARRSRGKARFTFNPRVVLDWDQWSRELEVDDFVGKPGSLGDMLSYHAERLYPMIVPPRHRSDELRSALDEWSGIVPPEHHEEKWISLFLCGSRGWSHEQVRHRFRTGVSQRSTRFVDEDGSPWMDHPLVQEYLADPSVDVGEKFGVRLSKLKESAREAYLIVADTLQPWLLKRGVDKLTARKQARGAARGYLGNALATEMVFSASAAQWKRMIRLRCNPAADAEIRAVFVDVIRELKSSRHAEEFRGFDLAPAPDGLGQTAVESSGVQE